VESTLLIQISATVVPLLIGMWATSVRLERRLTSVEARLDVVKEMKSDQKSLRGWVGRVDRRVAVLEAKE
tara:strand:+ start:474 stop:683 length:210 start_codon:yes stop_codon:yes gene_type:complete